MPSITPTVPKVRVAACLSVSIPLPAASTPTNLTSLSGINSAKAP